MPYVLAPLIRKDAPGLWAEGPAYSPEPIYDLCSPNPNSPPVNYSSHTLKPHSVCHFDAPGHILPEGKTIDALFDHPEVFFGPALVIRLRTSRFKPNPVTKVLHWEISREEMELALRPYRASRIEKVLLTFEGAEGDFYRDSTRAFTLSAEAARALTDLPGFDLFGTVWKSVDYQPGSRDRPVHQTFFPKAGILECLDLSRVPEGAYFLSAFPIPMEGATESPVCPVLFREDELRGAFPA